MTHALKRLLSGAGPTLGISGREATVGSSGKSPAWQGRAGRGSRQDTGQLGSGERTGGDRPQRSLMGSGG